MLAENEVVAGFVAFLLVGCRLLWREPSLQDGGEAGKPLKLDGLISIVEVEGGLLSIGVELGPRIGAQKGPP